MESINVGQAAALFVIYTLLVIGIPALLFYRYFAKRRVLERFMIYLAIGNFYIMNMVFLLQLAHISNFYTLVLFTAVPAGGFYIWQNHKQMRVSLLQMMDTFDKYIKGVMGFRTFAGKCRDVLLKWLKKIWKHIYGIVSRHKTEYLLILAMCVFLCIRFGTNSIINYGYPASDLPVHNYWVNAMGKNDIFVAGVYPFGFHCIVYYIHTVFGIDTYIIFRLFVITQVLYIHMALYVFIRGICRSAYAAYAGMFLYVVADFYNVGCTSRFIDALPQEYGMMFILPSIYFIFEYFRHQKLAIKEEDGKNKRLAKQDALLAAICFSMTIAVHFYDTMIAGLFCVAIVFGFAARIFRPKYFVRLMGAFLLGLFLGILPMAVAVIGGKPLQGSLGWGMNVITGGGSSADDDKDKGEEASREDEDNNQTQAAPGENQEDNAGGDTGETGGSGSSGADGQQDGEKEDVTMAEENLQPDLEDDIVIEEAENKGVRLEQLLGHMYSTLCSSIRSAVFSRNAQLFVQAIFACCGVLLAGGLLMCLLRQFDYGFQAISVSMFILVLLFGLYDAGALGLPSLMDTNRSRIYLVYVLGILFSMTADIIVGFIDVLFHSRAWMNGVSFALSAAICAASLLLFGVRQPQVLTRANQMSLNGAIECLYNIIKSNPDHSWTIVSANDELQMIDTHGYHYETITFLRYQKYSTAQQRLTIPTKYVYFYIEKRPLDYLVKHARSGQRVSPVMAGMPLPESSGIAPYKAQNRLVVMSKMYYWAKQFMKLFPQDMSVYYEDDEFICYRLIQNQSNLYSLVIDFGYNE